MGDLGSKLDLYDMQHLGLIDQWLGVSVQIQFNRPTSIWAFPIATVSQSEGGFEMVHQSVCVMPHWLVRGDSDGIWSCSMDITIAKEHQAKPRKRVGAPHFHEMSASPALRF
jgi:alpha-amylase